MDLFGQVVAFDLDGTLYRSVDQPMPGAVKRVAEIARYNRVIVTSARSGNYQKTAENLARDFPAIRPQDVFLSCGLDKPLVAYEHDATIFVDNCYEFCLYAPLLDMLGVFIGQPEAMRFYYRLPAHIYRQIWALPDWQSDLFHKIFSLDTLRQFDAARP